MTGESVARRAEDVGGQELSYAEVKTIASGNPAVLTLAEADAEVQRLSVLRKNHADEEYLARKALRELPGVIGHRETRLAQLEADAGTLEARADDPVEIAGRARAKDRILEALGDALDRLPTGVLTTKRFPLGVYRGVKFGIERHPGGSAEVYLIGAAERKASLSQESQGPRAVWNAVNRLVDSARETCEELQASREHASNQLRDFEARIGLPFPHAEALETLADLRDRLKLALAIGPKAEGAEKPGVEESGELSARIKELLAKKSESKFTSRTSRDPEVETSRG